MRFSLAEVQKWQAAARLVSEDDPLSWTIRSLLDTADEGMHITYTIGSVLRKDTELADHRTTETSLRNKLDDVNAAIKSFVGDRIRPRRALIRNTHAGYSFRSNPQAKDRSSKERTASTTGSNGRQGTIH